MFFGGEKKESYTPGSTNIAGWKMDPDSVDVFPTETWGIFQPAMLAYSSVSQLSLMLVYPP